MHISPDDKRLQYCGRIDFDDPKAPVLVYAASFVQICFTGTEISVTLANKRAYWSSRMGYILDGKQGQFLLTSDSDAKTYVIAEGLEPTEHTLTLFKRMDSCHIVTLLGFELGSDAEVLTPAPLPSRKIEVFGDSRFLRRSIRGRRLCRKTGSGTRWGIFKQLVFLCVDDRAESACTVA